MAEKLVGMDAAYIGHSKELQKLLKNNDELKIQGIIGAEEWVKNFNSILAKFTGKVSLPGKAGEAAK